MSKGKGKAPAKKAPAKKAPAKKEVVASKGGKAHYSASAKMKVTKSKKLSGISAAAKPAVGGRGSVSSQGVSDVLALNKES